MGKPTIRQLMDAVGISKSYASIILSGKQDPSRPLAIHIYRQTGWKADLIANLSDAEIDTLEDAEKVAGKLPWAA
jgi:transcriptional regulator with XRE-family HTH domain